MGMIKTIQARLRIPALLLSAFSLIALAGCGTEAPLGTTITVEAEGGAVLWNGISGTVVTTYKTQNYRVTLADVNDLPLNDTEVNFWGQFTSGQSIDFGGDVGSVPIPIVPGAPVSVTLYATQKTGDFGHLLFAVTAPYYSLIPLHAPYNQTGLGSSIGGQMVDGVYSYTITALDVAGETDATVPFTATVSGATTSAGSFGSVALSWQAVPGSTSYMVYGRIPGAESALIEIIGATTDPVTYVDTGSATPSGILPPVTNTSGLNINSVIGKGQASSGSALKTFDIKF